MAMNTSRSFLSPAEEAFLQALLWEEGHLLQGPATHAAEEHRLALIRCLEPANRLSPNLKGTGSRWSEGELRLRLVDAARINPATIMPSYYRVDGLHRVAQNYRGKPVLTAEQIEDVVAYLKTLRD